MEEMLLFFVAEIVGSTVADLLDPSLPPRPLTVEELYGWAAYRKKKGEMERDEIEKAKKG